MKNFCLITNQYKDPDLKTTNAIADYIRSKGAKTVSLVSAYHSEDSGNFSIENIPKNTECIIVLGGDGTLIRAATKVQSLQIPLIGVNLGTLGYLCEVSEEKVFRAVDRLIEDKYLIEDRIMLKGRINGAGQKKLALNDVVIHHGGDIQIIKLNVYINGEFLVQYKADGIIVATPTGSTGYSMSAGGPIVDPRGDMILLTPNNAHSIGSRSIVLNGEDRIEIEVDKSNIDRGNICVSLDGDCIARLSPGDRYVIERAKNKVHICKLHKRSFLEILSRKMERES